ncbi:hypothetical protein F4861DRAFT_531267 [Xylaria intraflava]|nr:hypothetical protein F4861DRAFT_531267 [Xylaria intraflava]
MVLASHGSAGESRSRPGKLRSACNQCCAAKVKCSGEKTGCVRCRNVGADCVFQESRVGKVPGIRAKRRQVHAQGQAPPQRKNGLTAGKALDSISVSTEAGLCEQSHGDRDRDHDDATSWATGWQLEPSGVETFGLLGELDTLTSSKIAATHAETPALSSGSSGLVTVASSEEPYNMLSSADANFDGLLMFQLATPLQSEQATEIEMTSAMPMSLGLRPRSEDDSQSCIECCQMINDLENYIIAELKAFKILLAIIRRALGRLAEIINSQQNSRNLRCIMLLTTLMYQILELLEACLSTIVAETSRHQVRTFSGEPIGIGFGDFTIDAEEQSAFRIQTILKEVHHAMETLGKLRALATGTSSSVNGSESGDVNQHSDHCLDLELRFKELRDRIQRRAWLEG